MWFLSEMNTPIKLSYAVGTLNKYLSVVDYWDHLMYRFVVIYIELFTFFLTCSYLIAVFLPMICLCLSRLKYGANLKEYAERVIKICKHALKLDWCRDYWKFCLMLEI